MRPNTLSEIRADASHKMSLTQAFDAGPGPAPKNMVLVIGLASMPLVALVAAVSVFAFWLAG